MSEGNSNTGIKSGGEGWRQKLARAWEKRPQLLAPPKTPRELAEEERLSKARERQKVIKQKMLEAERIKAEFLLGELRAKARERVKVSVNSGK